MQLGRAWRVLGFLAVAACGESDPPACVGACTCEVDSDCTDPNAACDGGTCTCSPGYASDDDATCVWSGILANPGFTTTGGWDLGPGVTIEPDRFPGTQTIDLGVAAFAPQAVCGMSRLSQIVTMPKASRSEPLVVVGASTFSFGTGWKTGGGRSCLGASAYAAESQAEPGISLEFSVVAWDGTPDCDPAAVVGGVSLDHVEIMPAEPGECPAPGTTLNGDAEGDGAWGFQLVVDDHHQGSGAAKLEAGAGEDGLRGARLSLDVGGISAGVSNSLVSVPTVDRVPSPAIRHYLRAPSGSVRSYVGTGGGGFFDGAWSPATVNGSQTACLPPSMRGNLTTFSSGLFPGAGGTATAVYDNLEIVNEPSCGTDPAITNPGFEALTTSVLGAGALGTAVARGANDPQNAHAGNGVLQLTIDRTCDDPTFVADVVVPPANGTAGPALAFFYKAPSPVAYQLTAKSSFGASPPLIYDGTYHRGVVCLEPRLVGHRQTVAFALSSAVANPPCYQAITAEQAFVDDLSATTDPSCPAM